MSNEKQGNRLWIKDVRIAYAQGIFEARGVRQADGTVSPPKYGAAFLFPKNHPCVAEIAAAVIRAAKTGWPDQTDEMVAMFKAGDKLPVHNGDAKATSAGFKGNLYLNAGNKVRPMILDGNKAPLVASDGKPYSGCYVNAFIEIWPQKKPTTRINAALLGVQFVRDGERLSGGSVATADDFEQIPGTDGETASPSSADSLFA